MHIYVFSSVRRSSLCFPLYPERSELGDLLNSLIFRCVSVQWLKMLLTDSIFSLICLHPDGFLRLSSSPKARSAFLADCPGACYTGIDGERQGASLGFGKFLTHDLMFLLALSPSSSIYPKLFPRLKGGSYEIKVCLSVCNRVKRTLTGRTQTVIT